LYKKFLYLFVDILFVIFFLAVEPLSASAIDEEFFQDVAVDQYRLEIKSGSVYLNSNNADLQTMLIDLAEKSNIKLLMLDGQNKEKLSVKLQGVSLEEAFRYLGRAYAIEFERNAQRSKWELKKITLVPLANNLDIKPKAGYEGKTLIDPNRGKEVDVELAKVAALYEVREFYGEARIASANVIYSVLSQPEAYCFVMYRGEGPLPTDVEITDQAQEAIKSLNQLRDKIINDKDRESIQKDLKEMREFSRANLWQTDKYVTVIAGAHEGNVPVIRMTEGLPVEKVLLNQSINLLQSRYPTSTLSYVQPIYKDQFTTLFEFSVDGRSVLYDPTSGTEKDKSICVKQQIEKIREISGKIAANKSAKDGYDLRKRKISEKWMFVRSLIVEKP